MCLDWQWADGGSPSEHRCGYSEIEEMSAMTDPSVPAGRCLHRRAVQGEPRRRDPRRRGPSDGDAGDRRWTNLSETTFVSRRPDPARRLPPAHLHARARAALRGPSDHRLGARRCCATGSCPGAGRLVQECGKGLVSLRSRAIACFSPCPSPRFASPRRRPASPGAAARSASGRGHRARRSIVDVGRSGSPSICRRRRHPGARPGHGQHRRAERDRSITGLNVFGCYPDGAPAQLEVRSFAPARRSGGSGLRQRQWLRGRVIQREHLLALRATSRRQGRWMGRDGRVEVQFGSRTAPSGSAAMPSPASRACSGRRSGETGSRVGGVLVPAGPLPGCPR